MYRSSTRGSKLVKGKTYQEDGREFLESRIWELGTITGRGFLDRRIWKQGSIKKQVEVNIRTQGKVGGSGCAIRGGGGTLKIKEKQLKKKSTSRRRRQGKREDGRQEKLN